MKEVILTPDGYKKLQAEIEELSTVRRREVADRIRVAREFGDIMENAEYDSAKNDQAHLEARIATLAGAAQERARRHEEGDPLGRGLGRDEGPAQGHGLEQDGRVPRRRLR